MLAKVLSIFFTKLVHLSLADATFVDPLYTAHVPTGRSTPYIGDKLIQSSRVEILIQWICKPLRNWADDHSLVYGNHGSLDPIAHMMKHRLTILESRIVKPLLLMGAAWRGCSYEQHTFLLHIKSHHVSARLLLTYPKWDVAWSLGRQLQRNVTTVI